MSVETPNQEELAYQLQRLVERFDHFTDRDAERWTQLQSMMLSSREEVPSSVPNKVPTDVDGRFLKGNALFAALPADELASFLSHGELKIYGANESVFRDGGHCDSVVAIRSGILEIRRASEDANEPVALLGTGEVLGMLGVMTGGSHRSSGRFPEGGEVFVMTAQRFDEALECLPKLSAALAKSLARRLMGVVQKGEMGSVSKRQLEGSLAHFDLSTVLQSLFSQDNCAGALVVMSEAGQNIGEIVVGNGRILACSAGDLVDREAFQQLFLADNSKNRFSFEEVEAGSATPTGGGGLSAMSGAGLLMDCARIADELNRIRSGPLGQNDRILKRGTSPSDWDEPATRASVREIWKNIEERTTVADIMALKVDLDHNVLRLLYRLMEGGHLL